MDTESFEFHGALIREQKLTFAVVEVPMELLTAGATVLEAEKKKYEPVFKDTPIVFAARGEDRRARYYGRTDIVKFLMQAGWSRIPWKRYRARKKDRNPFR